MKIIRYLVCCSVFIFSSCSDENKDSVHPIIGKWHRNFYQFKGLPGTHKNYENLMLPSHYVSTPGIYNEKSYELTFSGNRTFNRMLIYSNVSAYTDKGTWEIKNNQLVINSEKSSNDEVYTLHSNSGTSMAWYQHQTWLLLPDVVIDTLDLEYFKANEEMLMNKYANEVDLKMYFFFEKAK